MEYSKFIKELEKGLSKELSLDNKFALPRVQKVVVSIGIASLHTRKGIKDFSELEKNLANITGQKPVTFFSKKNISNFKLREGMPSMLSVTLRKEKAYYFLFKLMSIVLPRVRDFSGLSTKSFDQNGNYSLWLKNYDVFPELHPDDISITTGIQVTIATSAKNTKETQALLQWYGFVFHSK